MKWLGKNKIFLTLIAFILGSEDSLNCSGRSWASVLLFQVSTFVLIFPQVLFLKHHHPVQYAINFSLKNNSLDNSVIFQIPVTKFHLIFLFFVPWIETIFSYDIIVLYFSTKVSFYFIISKGSWNIVSEWGWRAGAKRKKKRNIVSRNSIFSTSL